MEEKELIETPKEKGLYDGLTPAQKIAKQKK